MTTERTFEHLDNVLLLRERQKKHKRQQMFGKTAKRSHEQPKQAEIYSYNCCLAKRSNVRLPAGVYRVNFLFFSLHRHDERTDDRHDKRTKKHRVYGCDGWNRTGVRAASPRRGKYPLDHPQPRLLSHISPIYNI